MSKGSPEARRRRKRRQKQRKRMCTGKEGFLTRAEANTALYGLSRILQDPFLEVYECLFCALFHVGHFNRMRRITP